MDISNWSVEDFVLNTEFRKWVLSPDAETNIAWEAVLSQHPDKLKEVKKAREILINLTVKSYKLSQEDKVALWKKVETGTGGIQADEDMRAVVPLSAESTIRHLEGKLEKRLYIPQFYRVVAILVLSVGLSYLAGNMYQAEKEMIEKPVVFTEHVTQPGVKSKLTLTDGTQVILNSGSRLYYEENFNPTKRELYLEGEAYFDVYRDPERPFIVHTNALSTTALGTSFSIKAKGNDDISIYLLTGKVVVEENNQHSKIFLEQGEAVRTGKNKDLIKEKFDAEQVMAWTRGIILFDQTPVMDAIEILENWYGVRFDLQNHP